MFLLFYPFILFYVFVVFENCFIYLFSVGSHIITINQISICIMHSTTMFLKSVGIHITCTGNYICGSSNDLFV